MPLYVAFLRAINVGGRTVRMERLRAIFTSLGFSDVETFIASGNVIFRCQAADAARLETRIEKALESTLGYAVATFVRNVRDLDAIARYQPFDLDAADASAGRMHVGFLRAAPTAAAREKILACRTDVDALAVHGREIYWLVRGNFHDSKLAGAALGQLTGPTTMRSRNTIARLAKKYPDAT